MGIFADEEHGTHNENDVNYQSKLNSNFKLFAGGAGEIECIHSNISPTLVKCEICNESNINFVYILRNRTGNTIKCGTRCASRQNVVEIKDFKKWEAHLNSQIDAEHKRIEEIRNSKRTIVRKKSK